jgi:hypothetical protein
MDVSKAGEMAAAQMEGIEKDFEDKEGHEIGLMINIVQIIGPNGEITNRLQHNAPAPFIALGLMRVAEELVLASGRAPQGDS